LQRGTAVKLNLPAWIRFAVCALTVFCVCTCLVRTSGAASQKTNSSQSAKESPAQVSGQVIRSDTLEPVPKAEVTLYPQFEASDGRRTVRSGVDGHFVFTDLEAGSYMLQVWHSGYSSFTCGKNPNCKDLSLKSGQKLDDLVVRMDPAGLIAGRVFDEDQDPVEGIQVYALRVKFLRGGGRQLSASSSATTDDQGSFRMANLKPGFYYLRAGGLIQHPMDQVALKQAHGEALQYRDTYYPGASTLSEASPLEVNAGVEASGIRFSVATERTYTVTGKVAGGAKRGEPKPTEVRFTKKSDAEQMFGGPDAEIAPDGSFKIADLSPGEYTLIAKMTTHDGREAEQGYASVRIVDSNIQANIEVGRAAEVRGKVEVPFGLSLAGKQIILQTNGMVYHASDISADGRFDIGNVPPGEYTLAVTENGDLAESTYLRRAVCSGKDYALQPLDLVLGTVLDCDLTVANDTGSVSGQVMEDEKPVPGFVIVLIPESHELRRIPRYTLTGRSHAAGRYQIAGAIPGDYLLFAVPRSEDHEYFALDFADRNQDKAEHVTVAAHAAQVVNLRPTAIR
jgi:Carboxypeptidase regulatory-like domain